MPIPAIAGSPDVQPAAPAAPPDATIAPVAADVPSAPTRVAPASPQPMQPQQAQQVVQEHHSALGAGMKRILGAIHGTYSTPTYDPKTGQIADVATPAKPGDIFRHIVAGAILGGAAGANAPESQRSSVLGGIARGGSAVMLKNEADQDKKRARAEDDREAAMKQQKLDDEYKYQQGMLAHYHTEETHNAFMRHMMTEEYNAKHNEAQENMEQGIQESGGQVAQLPTPEGKTVDGHMLQSDFVRLHNANPAIMNPPDKQHLRQAITHTDTAGLHWDDKVNNEMGGWVDKAGKPADLDSRTTVTVYDYPMEQSHVPHEFTGKQVNLAYDKTGKTKIYSDDAKVMLSLDHMIGVDQAGTKAQNEALKLELEDKRMKYEDTKNQLEMARLAHLEKSSNATDLKSVLGEQRAMAQSVKDGLDADIRDVKDEYDPARKKMLQERIDRRQGMLDELNSRIFQSEHSAQTQADDAAAKRGTRGKGKAAAAPAEAPAAAPAGAADDAAKAEAAKASAAKDVSLVDKAVKGMQFRQNVPTSYAELVSVHGNVLTSNSQRLLAATKLGLTIPWTAVQTMAAAAGIQPEQAAEGIKQGGGKVEPKPKTLPSGLTAPVPAQGS